MNDFDRLARLERFERLAERAPEHGSAPTLALEAKLAVREVGVLRTRLEETRRTLTALERRGEQRGAQMARRTVRRLEREILDARARAAGIPVPPAVGPSRGPRERAAIDVP